MVEPPIIVSRWVSYSRHTFTLAEQELLGAEVFDRVAEFGGFFKLELVGGLAYVGFEVGYVGFEVGYVAFEVGLRGEFQASVAAASLVRSR